MRLILPFVLAPLLLAAGPALADEHFYAFDPASSSARLMTRGVTLQVERGWFGATRVERLYSTAGEGSAALDSGGLSDGELRAALPAGAEESNVYRIVPEGTGAALGRVLCPGAQEVFLVFGRVRPLRDLTMHAIGRGASGTALHCNTLQYTYRGEWTAPDARTAAGEGPATPPRY